MVAGKVKAAIGLQKVPATSKYEAPKNSCSQVSSKTPLAKAVGSRPFAGYFPRAAQVQPKPPDLAELLRQIEKLQTNESHLRTQLLEYKILKESIGIVPILEKEISLKNAMIDSLSQRTEDLVEENETLKSDLKKLRAYIVENENDCSKKMREMEIENQELRRKLDDECSSSHRFRGLIDASSKSNLLKNLKRTTKSTDVTRNQENQKIEAEDHKEEAIETDQIQQSRCNSDEVSDFTEINIKSRAPRVPKPPPKPSSSLSSLKAVVTETNLTNLSEVNSSRKEFPPPPPPPPLPPVKFSITATAKVRRVPEVVELYHSLMRRDTKKDSVASLIEIPAPGNCRSMIGEIENRSAHLLAIKTDVETQRDFIEFLIKEVNVAAFTKIEDLVVFVKWLDDELSFLVDERAVLKHFDWPEQKADAMREAAFGYYDLKKLESEASNFCDDIRLPCGTALKKMQSLFDKLEHGVYNLSRVREASMKRYRCFNIPWEWMLENGFVSQIKLASVKLAMKYMKRVSAELEGDGSMEDEELMIQGVRFAFRVHQFAGGFDVETMRAFEELRNKAQSCHPPSQSQQQ